MRAGVVDVRRMAVFPVCLMVILLFGGDVFRAEAAASLNDLTGPWHLLVDDYPVAAKTNVVRTYHPLQKYAGNPVLRPTLPWEQGIVYLYGTVLRDESGAGLPDVVSRLAHQQQRLLELERASLRDQHQRDQLGKAGAQHSHHLRLCH